MKRILTAVLLAFAGSAFAQPVNVAELQKQLATLKDENAALKKENEGLKTQVTVLAVKVAELEKERDWLKKLVAELTPHDDIPKILAEYSEALTKLAKSRESTKKRIEQFLALTKPLDEKLRRNTVSIHGHIDFARAGTRNGKVVEDRVTIFLSDCSLESRLNLMPLYLKRVHFNCVIPAAQAAKFKTGDAVVIETKLATDINWVNSSPDAGIDKQYGPYSATDPAFAFCRFMESKWPDKYLPVPVLCVMKNRVISINGHKIEETGKLDVPD